MCGTAPSTEPLRLIRAHCPCLCTHRVLLPLATLTFSRNLSRTRSSPAEPTGWVKHHPGLWLQETCRSPWSGHGHILLCKVASVSSSLLSMMVCWAAAAGAPGLFPSELCKRCMWNLRCPLRLNLQRKGKRGGVCHGQRRTSVLRRTCLQVPQTRPRKWPVSDPKAFPLPPQVPNLPMQKFLGD